MDSGSVLGDPTGTFAVLRRDDERWMGRLMIRAGGGPAQLAFPADCSIGGLPLGTVLMVGAAGSGRSNVAQSRAKLLAVTFEPEAIAVEVEVDDPAVWGEVMPRPSMPYRDRRRWPRLQPNAAAEEVLQLVIDVGPYSSRTLSGHVMDRSEGGRGGAPAHAGGGAPVRSGAPALRASGGGSPSSLRSSASRVASAGSSLWPEVRRRAAPCSAHVRAVVGVSGVRRGPAARA